ncbi:MAG: enoyl-CoA hydratase/isomerase family protein [Phycisphaerales bacterium]
MAADDLVHIDRDGLIWTVSMNRPEKRNALSRDLIVSLHDAVHEVAVAAERDDVRVMLLRGEGKSFCAGMDLYGVITDIPAMTEMLRTLALTTLAIRALPIATVAVVQGAAVGGGCGLMVVCDLALTHHDARVGYPEVDLGLCPAVVAPLLIRKVGAGRARSILLQGGTMSGDDAHAAGMADVVVSRDDLDGAAGDLAARLCKAGKMATATTKRWLNELDGSLNEEVALQAAALSAEVIAGKEAQASLRRLFGE